MTDRKFGDPKVEMFACPACGAPIEGSGKCGNCSQLLLVTREYGVLNVGDSEIGKMTIKPPKKEDTSKDPRWEFAEDGISFNYDQSKLNILGKGSPEVGARMVAMYFTDHPEELVGGGRIAGWRDVEDYAISKAITSNRKR